MKLQKLGADKGEGDELVMKDSPMHTLTFAEKENSLRKAKTIAKGQKDDTPQVQNLTSNNPSMTFGGLKGVQQNEEDMKGPQDHFLVVLKLSHEITHSS
jgi:hypothetical protein